MKIHKNIFAYSYKDFKKWLEQNNNFIPSNVAIIEIAGNKDMDCNEFLCENYQNQISILADDINGNAWISSKKMDKLLDDYFYHYADYDKNIFKNGLLTALDYEYGMWLVKFIDKNFKNSTIDTIIIHCASGISRSQAIVQYCKDIYKNDYEIEERKDNPCLTPNIYILQILKRIYYFLNYKDVIQL